MEDRQGGREEEGREGRREGERDEGRKEGKAKESRGEIQSHQTPVFFTSIFPWFSSYQLKFTPRCGFSFNLPTTSHPLLRGALVPNPGNPGLARAGHPFSPVQPHTALLLSINPPWVMSEELSNPAICYFRSHSPLLACPPPSPSVHFYFSPLFINMSTLLLNTKGFLRNSFPHICLGVIWMFRMEIQRHKNRFCWFMRPRCFQFPISMGGHGAFKRWSICFPPRFICEL